MFIYATATYDVSTNASKIGKQNVIVGLFTSSPFVLIHIMMNNKAVKFLDTMIRFISTTALN